MGKDQLRRVLHIVAAVLIVVLVVGLYKAKTDAAKTQSHVRELQTQIDDSEADLRALRAEVAHLESPARVEQLAHEHLGSTVGSESTALPENAMDQRLPAPQAQKQGTH
jgi:cell division protein FtsL